MSKKSLNIIYGIVIVALVGVVVYFAVGKKSEPAAQQQLPTSEQATNTSESNPTSTPTPADQTANWKTYNNSTYGYEVKYPNNWKVSGSGASVNFMEIGGQDVSLSFFVYDKSINEAEALLPLFSVPGRNIDSRTNVTISGINWVKLVVEKNQIAQLTYYNGKTYAVQYSTFENVSPQILSTFKFTK